MLEIQLPYLPQVGLYLLNMLGQGGILQESLFPCDEVLMKFIFGRLAAQLLGQDLLIVEPVKQLAVKGCQIVQHCVAKGFKVISPAEVALDMAVERDEWKETERFRLLFQNVEP